MTLLTTLISSEAKSLQLLLVLDTLLEHGEEGGMLCCTSGNGHPLHPLLNTVQIQLYQQACGSVKVEHLCKAASCDASGTHASSQFEWTWVGKVVVLAPGCSLSGAPADAACRALKPLAGPPTTAHKDC